MATRAQFIFGANAVFAGDTTRTEVEGAFVYVDVEQPCSLLISITVDRAGNVMSAEVDTEVSTCLEKEVQAQAVRAVSERKFNAVKKPAIQRGTVLWQYRVQEPDVLLGWDVVVPEPTPLDTDEPLSIVEVMPTFPGGDQAMFKYFGTQAKYPEEAAENGIKGAVYVAFVVERDGRISDVKVLRGIGGGCDEEAVRVVRSMPNWIPGTQNGKVVRVRYNLPFRFHQ